MASFIALLCALLLLSFTNATTTPAAITTAAGNSTRTTATNATTTSPPPTTTAAATLPQNQPASPISAVDDAAAKWTCKAPADYRVTPIAGSFFCQDYVNYWAACNSGDPMSCNDTFVRESYANLKTLLSFYSCDSYSRIWTCDDCLLAYKRWVCSWSYKQCNDSKEMCFGVGNPLSPDVLPLCVRKTCQDVCYDVMRKCPVEVGFVCPPTSDTREYSPAGTVCNNLELPPPSAASILRHGVSLVVGLVVLPLLLSLIVAI